MRRPEYLLAALLLCGFAPAGPAMAAGGNIYCCEDANGRSVCGDVLPVQCYGRAYREISPQGIVRRVVAAPMTAAEVARQREEERRQRLEDERIRIERLRDKALLETYGGLDDIDVQQRRAELEVERDLDAARQRETELRQARVLLDREAEFYARRPMPPKLAKDLRENQLEQLAQKSVIESKQRQLEAIRARYEEDRQRYREILERRAPRSR